MRIALVTETWPPEINGVARTLSHLAGGLASRGHFVQVVRPRRDASDEPSARPGMQEVTVPGLPLPRYPDLRFGLPARGRLGRLWASRPPHVVHVATEGPLGWTAVGAARRAGIPVVSSFHTNFHAYGRHYGYGPLYRIALAYLRMVHNRTLRTWVPSDTMLRQLAAERFRNLRVLGRGVDTHLFSPERRDRALRDRWGVGEDGLVVVYVGRLAGEKNLPLLFRTWEEIRRVRPEARLLLVGDGPMREQCERDHPEAIFTGMRVGADLAGLYASADLFLFPSTTETFGNVLTEAMASGLVVLAYDYAAAALHIEQGVNGWKVGLGDEEAFVRAAGTLLKLEGKWPVLRWSARAAAETLSWEGIVSRYEEDLREISGRRAGRPTLSGALDDERLFPARCREAP
jgi:glycosyltransferase involved in cell wall biosynthesis